MANDYFRFSPCSGLVVSGYSKRLSDKSLETYMNLATMHYKKFKNIIKGIYVQCPVDQKKVSGREREESYDEMDGKSSDLHDAVFTGRVDIEVFKKYFSLSPS